MTPTGRDTVGGAAPGDHGSRGRRRTAGKDGGDEIPRDNPGLPPRAVGPEEILDALSVEGRGLEALRLLGSLGTSSRSSCRGRRSRESARVPILPRAVSHGRVVQERDCRRAAEDRTAGEVADNASPRLASIPNGSAARTAGLRTTPTGFSADERRQVSAGACRHRPQRPVCPDGPAGTSLRDSASSTAARQGRRLFVEPLETVDINNEIVALEERRPRRSAAFSCC